jgi:predicted secreted hydrolase
MRAYILLILAITHLSLGFYTEDGYKIPTPSPSFTFPRDHGSHPEFRIEWWYITGHLHDENQDHYGFQATFFRYALTPDAGMGSDTFGSEHIFMAHMAVSDIKRRTFYHEERLNRDGWDAFCSTQKMKMRNGNWTLEQYENERMELEATIQEEIALSLNLQPSQPHVLFGENGLSTKGADPSACSWYITYPRIEVEGQMQLDDKLLSVTGEAWMDHEISSSQLSKTQVGWDWLSVRFHDSSEMMLYILRDEQGSPDPHSKLVWIEPDGTLTHMGPEAFSWRTRDTWASVKSGAVYPIRTTLSGSRPNGDPFSFDIEPLFDAQELTGELGGIAYWEGACHIVEQSNVIGEAYMELTGYGESLETQLR